jgi:hypothetical protein
MEASHGMSKTVDEAKAEFCSWLSNERVCDDEKAGGAFDNIVAVVREECAVLCSTMSDEYKAAARDVEIEERPIYKEACLALGVAASRIRRLGKART